MPSRSQLGWCGSWIGLAMCFCYQSLAEQLQVQLCLVFGFVVPVELLLRCSMRICYGSSMRNSAFTGRNWGGVFWSCDIHFCDPSSMCNCSRCLVSNKLHFGLTRHPLLVDGGGSPRPSAHPSDPFGGGGRPAQSAKRHDTPQIVFEPSSTN